MIHEWRMGERLYYEPERREPEVEINRLLEAADRQALEIIQGRKDRTAKLAEALLKRETLTRDEVMAILQLSATERSSSLATT